MLCKSQDGVHCVATGDWEQGWIVFHDPNNNGLCDAGESLIGSSQALPTGYRFSGNASVASYVSYSPVGMARTTSGAFQAGTFTLCRAAGATADTREIALNSAGRPKIRKATAASC